MTIFQAGTGPFMLVSPILGNVSISTGGTTVAWATNCVKLGNTTNKAELLAFNASWTDGWIHYEMYQAGTPNNTNPALVVRNTSAVDKFRIIGAAPNYQAQWLNASSVWTNIGASWAYASDTIVQIDVRIKSAVSGAISVYQDKTLVASMTGDTSSMGSMNQMAFGNPRGFGGDSTYFSQILVADFSTINSKVKQSLFTALGSQTGWTGAVTDINEQVPDTTTSIVTSAAAANESFTAAARTLTGYDVKAVIAQFSALNGGATAPTQIRALLRTGGVNYFGATQALGVGIANYTHQFLLDPSTGLAWTPAAAGAAGLEIGVQSVA